MALNNKHIEDLFKSGLENLSINPSKSVWVKISKNLSAVNFLRFNPYKLNIYYAIIMVSAVTISVINPFNSKKIADNNLQQEIINSGKTSYPEKTILIEEHSNKNEKTIEITHLQNKIENNTIENSDNEINDKIINEEKINTTENIEHNIKAVSNDEEQNKPKLAEPFADFSASEYIACVPVTIHFYNASENCDRYLWDFGNGKTSSEIHPTFMFNTAGKYTVTLTVTAGGVSNSLSKEITVNPKPETNFIISNAENLFQTDELRFANLSTGFKTCIWNFGDKNTSGFTHPTHSYDNPGTYKVSLICVSEKNCSDTSEFISLKIKDTKYLIKAPTAFSVDKNGPLNGYLPEGTYSNNIFKPIFNSELSEFHLRIYNRFGNMVFESNEQNFGWNGYYNNQPAPEDTYIWMCSGKFIDGEKFIKTGDITPINNRNQ